MRGEKRRNCHQQSKCKLKSIRKLHSSMKFRTSRGTTHASGIIAPLKVGRSTNIPKEIKSYARKAKQYTHTIAGSWVVDEGHLSDLPTTSKIGRKDFYSCINSWKVESIPLTEASSYSSSSSKSIGKDGFQYTVSKAQGFVDDQVDHSPVSQEISKSDLEKTSQMPLLDFSRTISSKTDWENAVMLKENQNNSVELHRLCGKRYLLVLRHPSQIHFRGTLSVTPLLGVARTLGFEFKPGMKSHLIYSPKGISPLCLATTGILHTPNFKEMCLKYGFDANIMKRLQRRDVALLIEPAFGEAWEQLSGFFSHILKFNPLAPFRKEQDYVRSGLDVERSLGIEFVQPGEHGESKSFHSESADWDIVSEKALKFNCEQGPVRMMVFGGKGVGKSTFMRFMVNRWLTNCKRKESNSVSRGDDGLVVFIDFDPGQSEFVPPGCISVTLVSEPLLGPNYTHLKDPERMICVGDLDVGKCPDWYLQCANDLIKFCSSNPELSRLPWFINTMGFCRGIGADLAVKLIHLCHPSHVIQLQSSFRKRNFDPLDMLSCDSVNSWKGTDWNPRVSNENGRVVPEYFYYRFPSVAERNFTTGGIHKGAGGSEILSSSEVVEIEDVDSQWGLPAWQSRDFSVLAYFSRMMSKPNYSLLAQIPHTIKLSDLTLSLPSPLVSPRHIMTAFDARLVALCVRQGHQNPSATVLQNNSLNDIQGELPRSSDGVIKKTELWDKVLTPNISHYPKILFHMPLAPCIGYGIVRAIDKFNHELFLTTPLNKEKVALVDCLATSPSVGSIPKEVYFEGLRMNPTRKFIPYVMHIDKSNPFTRTVPRVFQPTQANSMSAKM